MTMPGIRGLYKIWFGIEGSTTAGTEADATTYWRGQGIIKDDTNPTLPKEDVGIIGGIGRAYWPTADATLELDETPATFEQLPYLLNCGILGVAGTQDTGGSGYVRNYPFPYDSTTANAAVPYTYTFEVGDQIQAEIFTYGFAEEIVIAGKGQEALTMKSTLRGWSMGPGTFTSTAPSVPAVEEILYGNTEFYLNDVSDDFGDTQVSNSLLSFELTISKLLKPVWTADGLGAHFAFLKVFSDYEVTLKYTLEHDSVAVAERAARRAGTNRAVRILAEGTNLTTAGSTYSKKTLIIDVCGVYKESEALDEDDGNMVIPFTLSNVYNTTQTERGSITVVNQLQNMP